MRIGSLIIYLLVFTQMGVCQERQSSLENLPVYPLRSIKHYCQDDTVNPLEQSLFSYDDKFRLIKISLVMDTFRTHVRQFSYNDKGLITAVHYYSVEKDQITTEKTLLISYNARSQVISEQEENSPTAELENIYHPNGQLMTRTFGHSRQTIRYKYDENGLLIEKDFGHYTQLYEYKDRLLVKEIKRWNAQMNETVIEFHYNDRGQLESKVGPGGNAVKLIYNDERLFKEYQNYAGIDPCFMPCCGLDLSVYTYY